MQYMLSLIEDKGFIQKCPLYFSNQWCSVFNNNIMYTLTVSRIKKTSPGGELKAVCDKFGYSILKRT